MDGTLAEPGATLAAEVCGGIASDMVVGPTTYHTHHIMHTGSVFVGGRHQGGARECVGPG